MVSLFESFDQNFGRVVLGIIGGLTVWLMTNWKSKLTQYIWLSTLLKTLIILALAVVLTLIITGLNLILP